MSEEIARLIHKYVTKFYCKSCNTLIEHEKFKTNIATCHQCRAIFRFLEPKPSSPKSLLSKTPPNISVENSNKEWVLTCYWEKKSVFRVLLFMFVLLLSIGIFSYYEANHIGGILILFPFMMFIGYQCVFEYLNQSRITISTPEIHLQNKGLEQSTLEDLNSTTETHPYRMANWDFQHTLQNLSFVVSIKHAPLPWWEKKSLTPYRHRDVKQVFLRENLLHVFCREKKYITDKGLEYIRYQVSFFNKNHEEIILLDKLQFIEQAIYIKEQLEEKLGITDQAVPEEVKEKSLQKSKSDFI